MTALPEARAANKPRTTAQPFGPTVYVVVGKPGTLLAVFPTRHDAVGWLGALGCAYRYDVGELRHRIVPVPVGSVPMDELRYPDA